VESTKLISSLTQLDLEFHIADMSFPIGFDPSHHQSAQSKRSKWGYQHMSRFWIRTIFEHKAVLELEYYMRMDTDSMFLSPVFDIFQDAKERGVMYGFRQAGKDSIRRNVGLWNLHSDYIKDTGMRSCTDAPHECLSRELPRLMNLTLQHKLGDGSEAPIFYTNFELVSVAAFTKPQMWEYILHVDASHGIYLHNWGDAQVTHCTQF